MNSDYSSSVGWNKSKSKMSGGVEESESKHKASIELRGNSNDICFINLPVNETAESIRQRVISFSKQRVASQRE